MPAQDSFQGNFAVWNNSSTADQYGGILNLYTKAYSAYSGVCSQHTAGDTKFYPNPTIGNNLNDIAECGNYLPHYERVTVLNGVLTWAVSRTGAANSWNILGSFPITDIEGGTPNTVGVWIQAKDAQQYNVPVHMRLHGYFATNSTNIQDSI
jgi:hypothetical protein